MTYWTVTGNLVECIDLSIERYQRNKVKDDVILMF